MVRQEKQMVVYCATISGEFCTKCDLCNWQPSYWTLANLQSEFCSRSSANMLEFLSQWPSVLLPFLQSRYISVLLFFFFLFSFLQQFEELWFHGWCNLHRFPCKAACETGNVQWNLKIRLQKFVQDVLLRIFVCHSHQLCVHLTVRTQGYHLNIVLLQAVHPSVYLHDFGGKHFSVWVCPELDSEVRCVNFFHCQTDFLHVYS